MSTVTPSQVRQHVPTDLADVAIQLLIDAAEELIEERVGPMNDQTEELKQDGQATTLYLRRPALSVSGVTEHWGSDSQLLDATDYSLQADRELVRLSTGTHASDSWGDRVKVTYVPKAGIMQRMLATIDLVRLSIQETGLSSVSNGDHSEVRLDVAKERRRILETLRARHRLFA